MTRSSQNAPDALYGIACWVLFSAVAAVVWPVVLVLPKLSWRWNLVRTTARLVCACLAIPFRAGGDTSPVQPCVYVANHASYLDSFALFLMFDEPVVFVAGTALSRQLIVGTFLRRIGAVFVGGGQANTASSVGSLLSSLEDVVRSGSSVVVFPEGGLTVTSELRRFKLGAFVVAAETGCPVVPVAIMGTRAMLPAGRRLPRRGAMCLVIGEPLRSTGTGWRAARQLADKARDEVASLLSEG